MATTTTITIIADRREIEASDEQKVPLTSLAPPPPQNITLEKWQYLLGYAIAVGNECAVAQLLSGEYLINFTRGEINLCFDWDHISGTRCEMTALAGAALYGQEGIMSYLLEKGADIDAGGGGFGTALTAATYTTRKTCVLYLLERGASVDRIAANNDFGTALNVAVYRGSIEIVSLLLDHNADVNVMAGKYGTPLATAVHLEEYECVHLLLDRKADINLIFQNDFGTVLNLAVHGGSIKMLSLLLDHNADINAVGGKYGTALATAVHLNRYDCVCLLLDRKADINLTLNNNIGTALNAAVREKNALMVSLLLRNGANPNTPGGIPLISALVTGDKEVAWILLKYGANVNVGGGENFTPLTAAVFSCTGEDTELVSKLLKAGADVDAVGGQWGTALTTAILRSLDFLYQNNEPVILLLVKAGANLGLTRGGKYDWTPLTAAAYYHQAWLLKHLVRQKSADIHGYGGEYGNVLCSAVASRLEPIPKIQALLKEHQERQKQATCNTNFVNKVGGRKGSAIALTIQHRNEEAFGLLVDAGADLEMIGGNYNMKSQTNSSSLGLYPNIFDVMQSELGLDPDVLHEYPETNFPNDPRLLSDKDIELIKVVREANKKSLTLCGEEALLARPPFPMPTSTKIEVTYTDMTITHNTAFSPGGCITAEEASVLCSTLKEAELIAFLSTLVGLQDETVQRLYHWLQNDVKYFIARNFDFGLAYAAARVAWKDFNEPGVDDNSISAQRGQWHWYAKQLDEMRDSLISKDENSGLEIITSPYSIKPRRIWDLRSNRVIEFRMLHSAHLSTQREPDMNSAPPYWAISHSWAKRMVSVGTAINQYQWPVPVPQLAQCDQVQNPRPGDCDETNLANQQRPDINYDNTEKFLDIDSTLRPELLNLGAEYVWLDVLCLHQETKLDESENREGDTRSETMSETIRKLEWKIDVPTIGNIYRGSERIVRYFNGLGLDFNFSGDCRWDDHCHWLKRAWTLQEIQSEHTTINAGIPKDMRARVLMNTKGKVMKIVEGKKVELEMTLRRAIRPVLRLAAVADSHRGCDVYELVREMAKREASAPEDKITGLLYLVRPPILPCYVESVSHENFWKSCFTVLPDTKKFEILFDCPYRGSELEGHWYPSWEQMLNWPERDPDCEHFTSVPSDLNEFRVFREGPLVHNLLQLPSVVIVGTGTDDRDSSEYELNISGRTIAFYTPYLAQRPLDTTWAHEFTLVALKQEIDYNWVVCIDRGQQHVKLTVTSTENVGAIQPQRVHVLKKVGVLRTDDIGSLLFGGENGKSLVQKMNLPCLFI